mgnify:CR=1 FL=1
MERFQRCARRATPSTNSTSSGSTSSIFAATGRSRSISCSQASFTAAPFRSVPLEAAVALVFGTLSVRVGMMRTVSRGTPRVWAAICSILVCRPWPISVPPWFTCTEPSR